MLPSLGFEGTAKVVNKGVDVALMTDHKGSAAAFDASRYLSVKGVSAAVVEMTCLQPPDLKTIRYFEDTTEGLIFPDSRLFQQIKPYLQAQTRAATINETEAIRIVRKVEEQMEQWKKM